MSLETAITEETVTTGSNNDVDVEGRLVILAGPSAVGKSTVVARLREKLPNLYFSVSATTRKPRPGEIDGQDYYFVSMEEFQQLIDRDELLEWADIHGGLQRSGTPRQPVLDAVKRGCPVLVEVDLAGARQIRDKLPDALQVFLAPPSWEVLVNRLVGRGTESKEVREQRLRTARAEMVAISEFDRVIVNDDLEEAVSKLVSCWSTTNDVK